MSYLLSTFVGNQIYISISFYAGIYGSRFIIDMGKSVEENPKMAYQILRNKNIDIQASDEVIDYFEQNELKLYDYFENIYHKNGKNR